MNSVRTSFSPRSAPTVRALRSGHADQKRERPEDPSEDPLQRERLDRGGALQPHPFVVEMNGKAQERVGESDQGDEGEQHRPDVQAPASCLRRPRARPRRSRSHRAFRLASVSFAGVGQPRSPATSPWRSRAPPGALITLAAIRCPAMSGKTSLRSPTYAASTPARHGREPSRHDRHQLGLRHRPMNGAIMSGASVCPTKEFAAADKRLGSRGPHRAAHDPREHADKPLHQPR